MFTMDENHLILVTQPEKGVVFCDEIAGDHGMTTNVLGKRVHYGLSAYPQF